MSNLTRTPDGNSTDPIHVVSYVSESGLFKLFIIIFLCSMSISLCSISSKLEKLSQRMETINDKNLPQLLP